MENFQEIFPESIQSFHVKHQRLYNLLNKTKRFFYSMHSKNKLIDYDKLKLDSIPILVNNFNRLISLKTQIDWLLNLPTKVSIVILDNCSTYRPLLQFYDTLSKSNNVQVIRLVHNYGISKILLFSMGFRRFDKYVITDSDLIPYDDTPVDLLDKMSFLLDKHIEFNHVGVSIEINDLPKHYPFKKDILKWEQQYWENKFNDEAYIAAIDTTFAMYRKTSLVTLQRPAIRLARPYRLKHLDWYIDPANLSKEQKYYIRECTSISTWNSKLKDKIPNLLD